MSVHDEIIIKQEYWQQSEILFRQVLDKEFTFYKLNGKMPLIDNFSSIEPMLNQEEEMPLNWPEIHPKP